ncbi:hypothetical protein NEOLI_004062 [Neolecta irregularis DAH-3]|uniref:Uncharacterized protein n=1 Tax=Neolecta irregularis (strain DAH-3) TaxID=1198029 RepID=A0A1U7LSG1_NEOID|nr:hypothetical protein NEOLI_004062 [Neolecta irregularis DAH-3]|eukprot:OLL25610.1 hypothetical protein NEOLI_004062 [Neolecta irregularis DAH-3]
MEEGEIIKMIRRILYKAPLDHSMVYAHAVATFPLYKYQSATPETLDVDGFRKEMSKISGISQAFELLNNHWVVLKWNFEKDMGTNYFTVASTKALEQSVLDIPAFNNYLNTISTELGIAQPQQ